MVFTHERMRNEVQKNVRKQTARLGWSRVSHVRSNTLVHHQLGWKTGLKTHSECGHGIQCVPIDLCGYECEDEVRDTIETEEKAVCLVETTSWAANQEERTS